MSVKLADIFENGECCVCGSHGVNQYFSINDNFIEYCGIFLSLRKILCEALDFHIDKYEKKSLEICLDCKDKLIKFYHFKRKAKEFQKHNRNFGESRTRSQAKEKRSKAVQNICKIIENYSIECPIATIKIQKNNNKLIIESSSETNTNETLQQNGSQNILPRTDLELELPIIKQERESPDIINKNIIQTESTMHEDVAIDDIVIKQEQSEELQDFVDQSSGSFINMPNFRFEVSPYQNRDQHTSDSSHSHDIEEDSDGKLSKAALKMRKYREKLKLPENREKFLEHQRQQRLWNRKHYIRKQAKSIIRNVQSIVNLNREDNKFIIS